MNKKLAKQTKEYLLEILDWTNNSNRKLALDCINEIVEEVLADLNEYLWAEQKKEEEKATGEWDTRHLEVPPGMLPPVDENGNIDPDWDPVKECERCNGSGHYEVSPNVGAACPDCTKE